MENPKETNNGYWQMPEAPTPGYLKGPFGPFKYTDGFRVREEKGEVVRDQNMDTPNFDILGPNYVLNAYARWIAKAIYWRETAAQTVAGDTWGAKSRRLARDGMRDCALNAARYRKELIYRLTQGRAA
jgi:hypothetical protein